MIWMEIRRCYAQIISLGLALLLIPFGGRFFPEMVMETSGGERPVISAFVLLLGFIILLMVYALASKLFRGERRNGSLEYMLTLPLGKWQLLWQKMSARLVIVLPFWIIYMFLAHYYLHDPLMDRYLFPINHPIFMQFSLLFMLGGGFLLSHHEQRNWGAIVSLLLFYDLVLGTMALRKLFINFEWFTTRVLYQNGFSYAIAVLICNVMLLYPFFSIMNRFDLRSFALESVLKSRALPLLVVFFVSAIAGLFFL